MANFNETNVIGSSYQRFNYINIKNDRDGIPQIDFYREEVINLGDKTFSQPVRPNNVVSQMLLPENYMTTFPKRDVTTGEIIPGEFYHYIEVYQILYSLAIDRAIALDEALSNLTPPTPTP